MAIATRHIPEWIELPTEFMTFCCIRDTKSGYWIFHLKRDDKYLNITALDEYVRLSIKLISKTNIPIILEKEWTLNPNAKPFNP